MNVYNIKEVSEQLHLSENTIRKYIKSGELKASLIGGKYLFTDEYIKEFLDANIVGTNE